MKTCLLPGCRDHIRNQIMLMGWLLAFAFLMLVLISVSGCKPSTPPPDYSYTGLKYLLLENYDVFWCDPYSYPIDRPQQEVQDAIEQFSTIRMNAEEFEAMLQNLGLPDKPVYDDVEILALFREHNKLAYALQLNPSGNDYKFTLLTGENTGERFEGTITTKGKITVQKREASINSCPICLTPGTLIDTPTGPIAIEQIRIGMNIWTVNVNGLRVAGSVLRTINTPVPDGFRVVNIRLLDDRMVTASAGHPAGDGRLLGNLRVGDSIDGTIVTAVDFPEYEGYTYDVLPSGSTGIYWANGVPLKSTLCNN